MKIRFNHSFLVGFSDSMVFDVDVDFNCLVDDSFGGFDGELFCKDFVSLLKKCLLIKADKVDDFWLKSYGSKKGSNSSD